MKKKLYITKKFKIVFLELLLTYILNANKLDKHLFNE